MSTFETIDREIKEMKAQIITLTETVAKEKEQRWELELELAELKGDVKYVKSSVDKMNTNMNRIVMILIAGIASGVFAVLFGG